MTEIKNRKEWFKLLGCGMCMGAADTVPGISGGTMAFILGIYGSLIASISHIRNGWKFLLPVLLGIVTAILALAHTIDEILNHEIYRSFLYSGFLGLIIASTLLCSKRINKWIPRHYIGTAIGALIAFILTTVSFIPVTSENVYDVSFSREAITNEGKNIVNYDPLNQKLLGIPESTLSAMVARGVITLDTPIYSHSEGVAGPASQFTTGEESAGLSPWLILCGAIAITAMLLPGISGSYLLVILGAYPIVIGAVADLVSSLKTLSIDIDAFFILTSVVIGIIAGALIFSRLIGWCLKHYHDTAVATLIGFMVGAIPAIWPFNSYSFFLNPLKITKGSKLEVLNATLPEVTSGVFWIAVACALVGFFVVIGLDILANGKKKNA